MHVFVSINEVIDLKLCVLETSSVAASVFTLRAESSSLGVRLGVQTMSQDQVKARH